MSNINAFFKLRAYENNKSIKQLSIETGLDKAYISRVFNNHIQINKDRNILKFCHSLNINKNVLMQKNTAFEVLFFNYINAIYYIKSNREYYYHKIIILENQLKNTIYYLHFLLVKMIETIIIKKENLQTEKITEKLLYINNSLENREKKLFLIFYSTFLFHKLCINEVIPMLQTALQIKSDDENMDMLVNYFIVLFSSANEINLYQQAYQKCKQICLKNNNQKRLYNLKIGYANFLRNIGCLELALQADLNLLNNNLSFNLEIVLNNIAWTYLLLNQFDQAIPYYKKVIKINDNRDAYFNLAWCYYNLNNNKEATKYIDLGTKSNNNIELYSSLLTWLGAMINKKYSQKSYHILLNILERYNYMLSKVMKEFIYLQLINFHYANQEYQKAFYYSTLLIDKNIISSTTLDKTLSK